MGQKAAEHYNWDERHLRKLWCIVEKVVLNGGGGRASKMSSEAKSVTGAIVQKRNLGLRETKLNSRSPQQA